MANSWAFGSCWIFDLSCSYILLSLEESLSQDHELDWIHQHPSSLLCSIKGIGDLDLEPIGIEHLGITADPVGLHLGRHLMGITSA